MARVHLLRSLLFSVGFEEGVIGFCLGAGGCVTVGAEQRAVLADPTMQFDSDPGDGAARDHVLENREGTSGGTSVKGGGCGCN